MIVYVQSDLFQSPAKVLVNAVNTVGVMGKGIAADFKRFYPRMFEQYVEMCRSKRLTVGGLHIFRTPHKTVLNFPTKKHWRDPSEIEYLEAGLQKFVSVYAEQGITSVSFPMLGTGEGGLNWEKDVRPLMEFYLDPLPFIAYIHHFDDFTRNTRTVGGWLNGLPQVVSFDKMWRDMLRLIKRKNQFQTEDGTDFAVSQDKKALVLSTEDDHLFLSESLLSDFWAYIRGAGYSLPDNFPSGLEANAPFLVSLFSALDYIQPVQLSTNTSNWQTGLHYISPIQKDAVGGESDRTAILN
jgi:O-acetyl-ADP-ribose deacetylase (regulator of RNase III)